MAPAGKQKSPKRLIKDLFDLKETGRPLFFPLIYRYASKVSKLTVEEMLGDAGNLSRSLMMARDLFDYDAIFSHYDNYLEMEFVARSFDWADSGTAAGLLEHGRISRLTGTTLGSLSEIGQIPVVHEATSRVHEVVGREIPVIGVVNSPVTLAGIFLGNGSHSLADRRDALKGPLNDLHAFVVDLIKAYCDERVDVVWIIEEDWSGVSREDIEWLRPLYETFWNVASYFDVKTVLAFHHYNARDIEKLFSLGANGVYFGGEQASDIDFPTLHRLVDRYGACVGIGSPFPEGEKRPVAHKLLSDIEEAGPGFFVSTPFEVPLDAPVEWLYDMVDRIKG
jgi:hypothetical protein